MATKKSKSSNKSSKAKSTKSAAEQSTAKSTAKSVETAKTDTVEKTTKHEDTYTSSSSKTKKSFLSGFFAKKYEGKESILTIFKDHKFYGALLGEVLGTMFLATLFFAILMMGIASTATYVFALIAILIAVYAFSGSCLNPLITVGMMASRRMSVIRGVMYIIAEVVGAWLGWLIFNALHLAGGDGAGYEISTMSEIAENGFWITAAIEFIGGIIIAFFFARALKYKRSVFTFAAVIAGGMILAILVGYVASAAFLNLNNNFIYNPALAMMLQIFPTSGDNFGEILGGICQALSAYAIIPMISGVIGFYLSDFTSKLSGEE